MDVGNILRKCQMTDEKWTTKDKINQYKGLTALQIRDREQQSYEASEEKKKNEEMLGELKLDVQYFRSVLENIMVGDRKELHNTLQKHRRLQLAYSNVDPEVVAEEMVQVNHIKIKALDNIKYQQEKKKEKLAAIKIEMIAIQDRIKKDQLEQDSRRAQQEILVQIQNMILKRKAAARINKGLANILKIMEKDRLCFRGVLESLRNDAQNQSRCILQVTELGQKAMEDVAVLNEKYKKLGEDVKANMREREKGLRKMKKDVEEMRKQCALLIRGEVESEVFERDIIWKLTPAEEDLSNALQMYEDALRTVQNATLVSTYGDIFPRMEMQSEHKIKFMEMIEEKVKERESLLLKKCHAQALLDEREHSMEEEMHKFHDNQKLLLQQCALEEEKCEASEKALQSNAEMLVQVRSSFQSLYEILQRFLTPTQRNEQRQKEREKEKQDELQKPRTSIEMNVGLDDIFDEGTAIVEIVYDKPPKTEKDAIILLETVRDKMKNLIDEIPEDLDAENAKQAVYTYQTKVAEILSHAGIAQEEFDFDLEEMEMIDPSVPTREMIKQQSTQLIAEMNPDMEAIIQKMHEEFGM